MTDRELLELAAKAAGIEYDAERSMPHPVSGAWFGLWLVYHREPHEFDRRHWNPLTDDGDALRLAVELGLAVMPYPIFSTPKHTALAKLNQSRDVMRGSGIAEVVPYGDDPLAATRRAIVRAAAEIGRVTTTQASEKQ